MFCVMQTLRFAGGQECPPYNILTTKALRLCGGLENPPHNIKEGNE